MSASNVNEIIDNICVKLGTTVERIVPEYAKYMIVSKLTTFMTGVVTMVITIVLTNMLLASLKKRIAEHKEEYNRNEWIFEWWAIVYIIFGIILVIIGIIAFTDVVSGLGFIPWLISPQGAFMAEVLH